MSNVQTCKNSEGKEFPVGDGYRLLEEGEVIPEGYEFLWNGESWKSGSTNNWLGVGDVWTEDEFVPFRVKVALESKAPKSDIEFFGHNTTIQELADAESAWRSKMLDECKSLDPKTKYLRDIYPVDAEVHEDAQGRKYVKIDVYSVLRAFGVDHPTGHAVKKLLCAGMRGKGDRVQDLTEAKVAIDRAIQEAGIG